MKMKCFLILTISLLVLTSPSQAQTCKVHPSCAELGYTLKSANCTGKKMLACPFDISAVYCTVGKAVPENGDILYGDGTVSSAIILGKTPIGVVFDGEKRLAIALNSIDANGKPVSSVYGKDVSGTDNISTMSQLGVAWSKDKVRYSSSDISSFNGLYWGMGKYDTARYLAFMQKRGLDKFPPFAAVAKYQPSGCSKDFCKQGRWFLPSNKEADLLCSSKDAVVQTLSKLAPSGAEMYLARNPGGAWVEYWLSKGGVSSDLNMDNSNYTSAFVVMLGSSGMINGVMRCSKIGRNADGGYRGSYEHDIDKNIYVRPIISF